MKKITKGFLTLLVLTVSTLFLTGCTESPETISQYENERFEPSYKTVDIIANKCDFKIQFVNKDITLNSDNIDRKEL